MWILRSKRPRHQTWAPVVLEHADDPAPLEQQDAVMLTALSGESMSVKHGAVAGAGNE